MNFRKEKTFELHQVPTVASRVLSDAEKDRVLTLYAEEIAKVILENLRRKKEAKNDKFER